MVLILFRWKCLAWADAVKFWNWDFSLTHLATLVLKCQTLSLLTIITHILYRVGLRNGHLPQWKKQHAALWTQSLTFWNDFILTEFPSVIPSGVKPTKPTNRRLFRSLRRYAYRNEIQTGKQNTSWRAEWTKCTKKLAVDHTERNNEYNNQRFGSWYQSSFVCILWSTAESHLHNQDFLFSFLCISLGLQSSDFISPCLCLQARERNKASASANMLQTRFQV